jgi:Fe2+ transport system protein B
MYSTSANPTETAQMTNTPSFPSSSMPTYEHPMYQPNQPQFYDGSITQVLQNPALNHELYMHKTQTPTFNTVENFASPVENATGPQLQEVQEVKEEQEDQEEQVEQEEQEEQEEIIDTSTGQKQLEEPFTKFDQVQRGKSALIFEFWWVFTASIYNLILKIGGFTVFIMILK